MPTTTDLEYQMQTRSDHVNKTLFSIVIQIWAQSTVCANIGENAHSSYTVHRKIIMECLNKALCASYFLYCAVTMTLTFNSKIQIIAQRLVMEISRFCCQSRLKSHAPWKTISVWFPCGSMSQQQLERSNLETWSTCYAISRSQR